MKYKHVVYEMAFGGDIDGTGPERWCVRELGRFDTESEAWAFVDQQNEYCEIYTEITE
jgi:hypothetical protein